MHEFSVDFSTRRVDRKQNSKIILSPICLDFGFKNKNIVEAYQIILFFFDKTSLVGPLCLLLIIDSAQTWPKYWSEETQNKLENTNKSVLYFQEVLKA